MPCDRGLENPIDRDQLILEKQAKARELLAATASIDERIEAIWQLFNRDYFLRHRSAEIAWHTRMARRFRHAPETGLVDVRRREDRRRRGSRAVYAAVRSAPLPMRPRVLDELGMTIMDARIVPLENGYSIDTYIFMEQDERVEIDESRTATRFDAH